MTLWQETKILLGIRRVIGDAEKKAMMDKVDPKNILKSKTFWFNAIAGVIGLAQQYGLFEMIPAPYGAAAVILGNLVLRVVTTQPVTILPQKEPAL